MKQRPDLRPILDQLKGFQRDTVEYAFRRLYLDEDSTHRFLVADEVGLGKTLVARGVVAKAIDHLWDKVERIDVIYICSNANIARQNVNRLTLPGSADFARASRITLLPLELQSAESKEEERRVNFISFTPGTSFEMTGGSGVVRERVLLYWMLREAWGFPASTAPKNVLQAYAGQERFRQEIEFFPKSGRGGRLPYDRKLAERFMSALGGAIAADRAAGRSDLRSRFESLCDRFARSRDHIPPQDARDRERFIGDLRTLLARTCLGHLEPDLVILDEFQRFRNLLDGESPAAELAKDLFNFADESTRVRVLLLSATPYKMYTLAHEQEEDNHYEDFLRTVRFLEGERQDEGALSALLQRYRQELYALGAGGATALDDLKLAIEARLRRVMARTERLRVDGASDGMLRDVGDKHLPMQLEDVRSFTQLHRLAVELEQPNVVDYWKSAPYLLNFMTGYKLKESLLERLVSGDSAAVRNILTTSPELLLSWDAVERYAQLDPGNSRLRTFLADVFAEDTVKTLWLPPAAPYYALEGAFAKVAARNYTKRLVFSSWTVVPRVVSSVLSYEAERRIFSQFESHPANTPAARERRKGLLTLTLSEGRLSGMPVLALMYPSIALARLVDPVLCWRTEGRTPTLGEQLTVAEQQIKPMVDRVVATAPTTGIEDERWYWAAPLLMDKALDEEPTNRWLGQTNLATLWSGVSDEGAEAAVRWADHVDLARRTINAAEGLGRPPNDLCTVMALLALAGPATAALRSFARLDGSGDLIADVRARTAAAQVGWSFRSLFNQPEAISILRAEAEQVPYWLRVLQYSAGGCLQAVLDEYGHLLRDFEGLFVKQAAELAEGLAAAMTPVIGLRTSNLALDQIAVTDTGIERHERRLRTRFAMRLGREKAEAAESEADAVREDVVRAAFNSPFWPYALITTSIGQEGLDFHPYCHAIVHWNLPANPVDLEQREGRVHRFKGHAIRKNVALRFGKNPAALNGGDVWQELFEVARANSNGADRGLSPYWVYPVEGGASIERHAPCLPLSRDGVHLENLRRSLAVYRMVFGQPRQDDLMAYLLERVGAEVLESKRGTLRISLAPPPAVFAAESVAADGGLAQRI